MEDVERRARITRDREVPNRFGTEGSEVQILSPRPINISDAVRCSGVVLNVRSLRLSRAQRGRKSRQAFRTAGFFLHDDQVRKPADATRLRTLTGGHEPEVSLRQEIEGGVDGYERALVGSTTHPARA